MTQIIQHKRRIGAGAVGGPAALAAGELAYNANGQALYVGADAVGTVAQLVGVERQLEIHAGSPPQAVAAAAGAKTFPIAKIKIPGGNVGEVLTMSLADGTLAYAPIVSASQQFVGSAKGDTGAVQLTAAAGGGTVLPAPAPANSGWYVIFDVAGATPPPASGVPGPFQVGDWLISNGVAWTHLQYGGIETQTAADIATVPPVTGGSTVQEVLETMQASEANHVVGPVSVAVDGNIAVYDLLTGKVIKDGGQTIAQVLATAGDVKGPATAVLDHIAVYADTTGKVIKNATKTIASLDADIAARGDVFSTAPIATALNLAVFSDIGGKLIADGGQSIADLKTYVDTAIAAIPGATPPVTFGPDMIGDGAAATPITWTGIKFAANAPPSFTGLGTTALPLSLVLIDGGTY